MKGMLAAIYDYKQFIYSSIKNDLIHRFAASKLGCMWTILNPLAQVLIYALILSNVLHNKLHGSDSPYAYAIYLMAGLLGWNLFNELIMNATRLFVANANLMKKIQFPKVVLPLITAGSTVVNNILLFIVMLVIFALLGHGFNWTLLWLVPLTIAVVLLGLGIGLILGVFNVFIRDIDQAVPIVMQIWFWFTPVVYPEDIIPVHYRALLQLNPMYCLIDGYHRVIFNNLKPNLHYIIYEAVLGFVLCGLGFWLFRRAGAEMVDVL